jgi:hypothetical protein
MTLNFRFMVPCIIKLYIYIYTHTQWNLGSRTPLFTNNSVHEQIFWSKSIGWRTVSRITNTQAGNRGKLRVSWGWSSNARNTDTLRQRRGKTDHTKPPDTITHTFVYHSSWPGSIVSPDDGQGTPETCRDVLYKIRTISNIKLDTYILL